MDPQSTCGDLRYPLTPVESTAVKVSLYRTLGAHQLKPSELSLGPGSCANNSQASSNTTPSHYTSQSSTTPNKYNSQEPGSTTPTPPSTAMLAPPTSLTAMQTRIPYDVTFDKKIVDACMPPKQHTHSSSAARGVIINTVAVRTAEIDHQIALAINESHAGPGGAIQQVVLIGSGMDPRAWRLDWPPGTTMYEVDTGSAEAVKRRVLSDFPLKCERVCVRANVGDSHDLKRALLASGFEPKRPCVWVLEGLVGYLSAKQGNSLFRCLHALSAQGSRAIITSPPTPRGKQEADQQGYKLYHTTFEEPEETFARICKAGWQGRMLSAGELSEKYGVSPCMQAIVVCYKTRQPRRPCVVM